MSLVIISGRLGKDAVVETTQNGTKVVRFNIAENDFKNGEDTTIWYDAVSFNTFVIDKQIKVLKKGAFVIAVGDLSVRPSFSKSGQLFLNYDVIVNSIKLVGTGNGKRNEVSEASDETSNETEVTTGKIEHSKEEPTVVEKKGKKIEKDLMSKDSNEPASYTEEANDEELPF